MDPVTLAVVRGALEQIADEMDLHLIRAAISPLISENNDCAHGIFHPQTGETIAQGGYGLPMFLANMQFSVQRVIALAAEQGGFRDGDVWIVNDPYLSGTHLQDVVLVAPYFADGNLFALLANTGHWMDIGGVVAGGWAPTAQEIHQEGLIIPGVKLYDEGRLNESLVKLFLANVRLPTQISGDLAAMANVFHVGRRGLETLVKRYGVDTLNACISEMMTRSEQQMRSYISEIPDGTYRIEDFYDNDGIVDAPLRVPLALTVEGSSLHFDFTGTSPVAKGPMNMSDTTTRSLCFVALKHIFPEVPVNGGAFRPTRFTIPQGSILAAQYPAPVCGYTELVHRIIDVVFGALAQAIPQRTPAAAFGTTGVTTVSGIHPRTGKYYVAVYPYPGGYGATAVGDGLVHGTPPGSMASFMSVEMSEHRYPLRFEHLSMREDTGGAGRHRGGCGSAYTITALADCSVSVLGDRVDFAPFGIEGGKSAATNKVAFETGGKRWEPPFRSKMDRVRLLPGERVHLHTPGGGGFGDPLERDADALENDLNLGYVSAESAATVYGAVTEKQGYAGDRARYRVNREKTRERRAALSAERRGASRNSSRT